MERRHFEPGQRLFREGEEGKEAFIIETGRVEIAKSVGHDETCILAIVGKGEMIGEMALIEGRERTATARAIEAVTALVVPRDVFAARLDKTDPVIRRVLGLLIRRLRDQTETATKRHTIVR